jgi:cell division protein FtsQ
MASVALKRGQAAPKAASARPVSRAAPVATVALPVSAATLRRNLLIGGGLLIALAGIAIAALFGVWQRAGDEFTAATARAGFEVNRVEITGNRQLSRMDIYKAVLPGRTNAMLSVDLAAIRGRLLALPWVADASVGRRLPDTLDIVIVERRPVALWQYRGRFAAIDGSGKLLTATGLERYAGLPVVVGPGANARVRELLALAAAAPSLGDRIDAAVLVGGRRWDIRFKSGETLLLPDTPAAATAAIKRFARIEAAQPAGVGLLGGRFARFDMRLPGRMTVGGPAVADAIAAAEKAARAAKAAKPATI